MLRHAGPEIQIFVPSNWAEGPTAKIRIEGLTTAILSPGANPSVASFVPEKSGTPGSIKIHNLQGERHLVSADDKAWADIPRPPALAAPPACQKSFFKADRVTIKWNPLGTLALVLTQTEVDKSNKSYYGETGLYLLSAAGNFDSRIILGRPSPLYEDIADSIFLDKEGPIHDFAWNPNSKEFCVVYGFMPAKATLFDQRVKPIYEFGAHPHNFVSWNPQGRLLALAGFGNLAGKMSIYDRRTLNKLSEIDAPNTSHFEWSHDGTKILTATLSPRLRVDNGIKIWWCNGTLLHVQMTDELYQANFRPAARNAIPPFPANVPLAPTPSISAEALPAKPAAAKPAGAYRPPGAQGRAAPSIFKREDEGGSGAQTPPRGVPGSMGYYESGINGHGRGMMNGHGRGRGDAPRGRGQGGRYVPGAAPANSAPNTPSEGGEKTRKKKGKGKREEEGSGGGSGSGPASGRQTPTVLDGHATPRGGRGPSPNPHASQGEKGKMRVNLPAALEQTSLTVPSDAPSPLSPGDGTLDPVQKKIRNLNKKVRSSCFLCAVRCRIRGSCFVL